jgi:hypothetical protein
MLWDRLIALVTLGVDVGILWILVKEFNFDKIAYEKEQYKKRAGRKKRTELSHDQPIGKGSAPDSPGTRLVGTTPPNSGTDLPHAL